tara:strand:+ start:494 stop:853 length:360 start_codon:yes stop_codon:yes gene_type:complete
MKKEKLKMVKNKEGQPVPFYAADGEGKMMGGGKVKKGYAKGSMIDMGMMAEVSPSDKKKKKNKNKKKPPTMMAMGGGKVKKGYAKGGMKKKGGARGGVRGAGKAMKGVRPAKMVVMKGS